MVRSKEKVYTQFEQEKTQEDICINCKFFHPISLKGLDKLENVLVEHHCLYPENYKEIIRENSKGEEIKYLVKIEKVYRSNSCSNFKINT